MDTTMTAPGPCTAPVTIAPAVRHRHNAPDLLPALEPDPDWCDIESEISPAMMTIATVGECEDRWDPADVTALLARLAATDELVVVCGSEEHRVWPGVPPVVAGLRRFVPRHNVVVLYATPYGGPLPREAALLDELLDLGVLPVVITPPAAVSGVADELQHRLRADRVVRIASAQPAPKAVSAYTRSAA
jgi:hypothetical protein